MTLILPRNNLRELEARRIARFKLDLLEGLKLLEEGGTHETSNQRDCVSRRKVSVSPPRSKAQKAIS